MAGSKTNIERLQEQAEKQKKKERESFIGKVEGLVQKSYNDIPTFPYGYHDEVTNPKGRKAPKWVKKPKDFVHDWLSSTPTEEQLNNLYGQLDQYISSMSPHMLKSSRRRVVSDTLTQKGTAVTPVCFEGMKHLYHIVRFRNADGRFLEFLRENSSGYTLAFRLFDSLDQASKAYWCYFSDEVEIAKDLKGIFKFKKTQYKAAYSYPAEVRFGKDTFDLGFHLLGKVYEQYANVAADGEDAVGGDDGAADGEGAVLDGEGAADGEGDVAVVGVYRDNRRDHSTVVVLHFYFFVLGECPRSDLFKKKIYATIETECQNDCEPVGLVFDGVARHWNYTCKAALLLRLMIKGIKIACALKLERPDIYVEVKKELRSYSKMAQERCQDIVGHYKNIQDVFKLTKEKVYKRVNKEVVGCYMYKNDAYNRIVDGCLSLVMYSELVLGVAVRERGYLKPLYLEDYVVKESSTKAVDAEASFVVEFKSFETKHKEAVKEHRPAILLSFLGSAVVFLKRWGYSRFVNHALDLDDVNKWCRKFEDCKQSKSELEAGRSVMGEWLRETKRRNEAIKEALKEALEQNEAIKEEEGLKEALEQNEAIKEEEGLKEALEQNETIKEEEGLKEALEQNEAIKEEEGLKEALEQNKAIKEEEGLKETLEQNEAIKEEEGLKAALEQNGAIKEEGLKEALEQNEAIKEEEGLKEAQEQNEAIKEEEGLQEAQEQNEATKEAMVLIDLKAALKALIRFIEENIPLDGSDVDSDSETLVGGG